ncbi:tRNA uridine-5-carboxymethylaminomethyl(34) synthesis GTPase MnmE [candidate division WOR-3 bacterium]|nr:tRNA uridine-5-carboxymethylaminomethyl(34) synthesis GTPase MnmE [candidate division WOR-3 bacterium]
MGLVTERTLSSRHGDVFDSVMHLDRLQDVIVAPATPAGVSAVAMVRVCGPQTLRMCDQVFKGNKRLSDMQGHRLVNGLILDGKQIVDEVIAAVYRAPHSYTTEDMVEFYLHGNPIIVDRVMDLLVDVGARVARPGEFTERAYLHGRIDMTQAEAVLAAIEAKTIDGIHSAMAQLRGDLSVKIEDFVSRIKTLVTNLEAQLEFPEEDLPEDSSAPVIKELLREVEDVRASFRRGRSLRQGLSVVLLGRPNVGKSTLFNALLGEERAIVTPVAGTTRDLVVGKMQLPGGQVRLFDTAGLAAARALPDKMAVRRAIGAANRADFLVIILDATSGFVAADEELLKLLQTKPGVVVWNKIDKVKKPPSLSEKSVKPLPLSALKRTNIDLLAARLTKEVSCKEGDVFFANRYQEDQLKRLAQKLRSGLDVAYMDMRAKELREALGLMTGADHSTVTEKILDDMFTRFCIGK